MSAALNAKQTPVCEHVMTNPPRGVWLSIAALVVIGVIGMSVWIGRAWLLSYAD